ncbi:MAG TPA: acyl-CoA thioester hydrolase/BAAT C-terminal domain-containing protein [Chloroflexota bacterium]|jgi:fermentation-respiration switch protein FrsA (DUF1100 family)|nr:acyl-CoA thioester hydrolase/BAAT C-terminal domain-containing protein [Chloroflexota bacterium]
MVLEARTRVRLTATPARALNDVPVSIRLSGLAPGQSVELTASLIDDFGREWKSHATYVASAGGETDVAAQAPESGSYSGVDGMGLLWSMAPTDGKMVNGAIKSALGPSTIRLVATVDGQLVGSASLERLFVADGVKREDVRSDGLVGTLFIPAGQGPFPGMLVFTGSGGGIEEWRAALLASHGYTAFALAYFNAEGLPDGLIDIPIEYFERGLNWIAARPEVDANRIGVTGGSRGGELVLLLGSMFPSIKAIVSGVPSAVVWSGFGKDTDQMETWPVAWTYGGKPIPAMPGGRRDDEPPPLPPGEPIPLTPGFLKAMENVQAMEAAAIPAERSEAAIMLISGIADAMWPSAVFADMVEARLTRHGYVHPVVNLKYPNAGHMIKPPFVPTTVSASVHQVSGDLFALGGTAVGNAHANLDSWVKTLTFLSDHLNG